METLESGINTIVLDGNKILSINERDLWNVDITLHDDWKEAMSCFMDNVLNEIMLEQCTTFDEIIEKVIKPQWKIWDLDHDAEFTVYDWDSEKIHIGTGFKSDENWEHMTVLTPIITIKPKQ